MNLNKHIAYQIESQFPALYKEYGAELIELVKSYYEFMESIPTNSVYNNRRMFEYKDIDNTLGSMLLFYKNKYLQDLPFDDTNIRFITKHILDLYRRRGTRESVYLFFRMFYNDTVEIYYPSSAILRPSASMWNTQRYIQLYPVETGILSGLSSKKIVGSVSRAEATVDTVVFIILDNTLIPVIYLNTLRGSFIAFDDILSNENGILKKYGTVSGSLEFVSLIDDVNFNTSGHSVGDVFMIEGDLGGIGGEVIVTDVSTKVDNTVSYTIIDGGFGYTRDNTLLLASDQLLFLDNSSLSFVPLERLSDGVNVGTVIGQNIYSVGVRMDAGDTFANTSTISTLNRNPNIVIDYDSISIKNSSSPGILYPEEYSANSAFAANTDSQDAVQLGSLLNVANVEIITDFILPFANVPLNSLDFNTDPAKTGILDMSGIANTVTMNTALSDAFDIQPIEIGTIDYFLNINHGDAYFNEVFALAHDPVIESFKKHNQILNIVNMGTAFSVGDLITQGSITGLIKKVNVDSIVVLPYTFYDFNLSNIIHKGVVYTLSGVSYDYSSPRLGLNSDIKTATMLTSGKILRVKVTNSGYGYDNGGVSLIDQNGIIVARGMASSKGTGIKSSSWNSLDSHLNFASGQVIQDSYYFQEFSYEIGSLLDINTYEKTLKDIVHVAGTKVFGKFLYKDKISSSSSASIYIIPTENSTPDFWTEDSNLMWNPSSNTSMWST